jgi:hypothetical protein
MQNWQFPDILNCLHSEFCILNYGSGSFISLPVVLDMRGTLSVDTGH